MALELFSLARACLEEKILDKKIQLSSETVKRCRNGFRLSRVKNNIEFIVGSPPKPCLVALSSLPKRGFASKQSRLSLIHAIAHIEFNAINLAWDAIYRFQDMPEDYYRDWLKIAGEETRHFTLLRGYLLSESCDYGDFDAHDGLWRMAEITADDVLHRMAIVPRVLEARGLDVTPAIIKKFANIKETEMVDILEIIYRDEIGHVYIGNKWFHYLCEQRGLDADETFIGLVVYFKLNEFKGEINREARSKAGFSQRELNYLENEFVKA